MTSEAALLKTLQDSPHKEAERLVYADWLDENANPHGATLVRTHCEMLKAIKRSPSLKEFFPAELELRAKCGKRWLKKYERACGDGLLPISVSRSWARIRKRMDEAIPWFDSDDFLNGATLKEIAAVEKAMGLKLPEDFKHSYRIHNEEIELFFFGDDFDPLKMVLGNWEHWAENHQRYNASPEFDLPRTSHPPGAIRCDDFPREWIPLLFEEGTFNNLAIDLAPGPKGHVGQVILFSLDQEKYHVVGKTWAEFLEKYASLPERIDFSDVRMDDVHTFSGDFTGHLFAPSEETSEYFIDALRWLVENGKW